MYTFGLGSAPVGSVSPAIVGSVERQTVPRGYADVVSMLREDVVTAYGNAMANTITQAGVRTRGLRVIVEVDIA